MKTWKYTFINCGLVFLPCALANYALAQQQTPYQVVNFGGNYRVWQRTVYETGPQGQTVPHVQQYTEAASGLYYLNAQGAWTPSQELIQSTAAGAVAQRGAYQVTFLNNLNAAGAVDQLTPDQKRLTSNIIGLAYYESSSGSNVLFAQVQDCQGELIASNVVLYTNAMTGTIAGVNVNCDVQYTYKMGSFSQDIILREQPPDPASFGLNPQTTEIEVLTEYINSPEANIIEHTFPNGLPDEDISWGMMRIGQGTAFEFGGAPDPHAQVFERRQLVNLNGRVILVEGVPYQQIQPQLSQLPLQSRATVPLPLLASKSRQWPKTPLAQAALKARPIREAAARAGKGFVLDYVELDSDETNFVFQGDTTYFISGSYNLSGTTTLEGSAIIKENTNGVIKIQPAGAVNCLTASYRPCIFTSLNDNTLGDPISGSSGSPALGDVDTALTLDQGSSAKLQNLRFVYGTNEIVSSYNLDVWDSQFVNVHTAIRETSGNLGLHNVLIKEAAVDYPIEGNSSSNFLAEQVTCDGYAPMVGGSPPVIALTNCLTTSNGWVWVDCGAGTSAPYSIYQTVGAGSYYLATNSPYCGAGNPNIDPVLLADIAAKTTWPPAVYAGTNFTAALTLGPLALRDNTGTPDIGYHYDCLDWVFGGCDLHATLTCTAGTAVSYYETSGLDYFDGQPYGLAIDDGGGIVFSGTAAQPCAVVLHKTVQEGNGNWNGYGWNGGFVLNGSGAQPYPLWSGQFTRFSDIPGWGFERDWWAYGVGRFADCEFYVAGVGGYRPSFYVTNCLFWRTTCPFWDQEDAASVTFQNCTFFNCGVALDRYAGQDPSFWNLVNNAFDGTAFITVDNLAGTTNLFMDYNAYNSSNTSWMNYDFGVGSPATNTLETVGLADVMVTNYNWQTGLLGNFYLPTNSALTNAGSTTPALAGLAYFTTLTNQEPDSGPNVNIGYHYPISGYLRGGLVAYWPLHDGHGTNAVDVISGNNLTLMTTGTQLPTWGPGYLSFDGATAYCRASNSSALDLQSTITICAWINSSNFPATAGVYQDAVELGITNIGELDMNYREGYYLRLSQTTIEGGTWDGGPLSYVTEPNDNSTGQWYYFAATYDGINWTLYINGLLDGTPNSGSYVPQLTAAPFFVGAGYIDYPGYPANHIARFFNGTIHDVAIYDRALSPEEVAANYFSTALANTIPYPNLLYLKMLEGATNTTGPGPVSLVMADASTFDHTNVILTYPYTVEWLTNVASVPNSALHFNGTASYIDTHDTNSFNFTTNPFTVNFWALTLTGGKYLFSNGGFLNPGTMSAVVTNGWYIKVGGSESILFGSIQTSTSGTYMATPNGSVSTALWNMVTCVWDGVNGYIYIDGIPAVSGSFSDPASSGNSLVIGQDDDDANFYDGDMWLPQIWSSALTPTDIANLYFTQSQGIIWP